MAGVCCCFCHNGANAFVWDSESGPLGNYTLQRTSDAMGLLGNVIPFNKSSGMYLTGAQQFSVAQVPLYAGGEPLPMYIGQRFGSADDGAWCAPRAEHLHTTRFFTPLTATRTPQA